MPITSTFDAEALAEYFDKHPDTLAEVSQYTLEKAPFIQTQREEESLSRRNIRGRDSADMTKQGSYLGQTSRGLKVPFRAYHADWKSAIPFLSFKLFCKAFVFTLYIF